jgi:Ca2+-dependent lipid-binding protein
MVFCSNLKDKDLKTKSDPMCVTYLRDFNRHKWEEFHRSEIVKNNLSPTFTVKPSVPFSFQLKQSIMFKIYDVDAKKKDLDEQDYLGYVECSLGELVSRGTVSIDGLIDPGE